MVLHKVRKHTTGLVKIFIVGTFTQMNFILQECAKRNCLTPLFSQDKMKCFPLESEFFFEELNWKGKGELEEKLLSHGNIKQQQQ